MSAWSWSLGALRSSQFPGVCEPGRAAGVFIPDAAWFLFKRRNRLEEESLSSSACRRPVGAGSSVSEAGGGRGGSRLSPEACPARGGGGQPQGAAPSPARSLTVGTLATNTAAPFPGSYSGSVSPFGGRIRVDDQELKLAKGKTIEARNLRSAEDNGLFSAAPRWFEQ